MKIAIIGAGIFGCVTALKLRERFPTAKIKIYDQSWSILMAASNCNQYRLHRGFHYPRSNETVEQQLNSIIEFENEFKDAVVKIGYERYYAIANKSKVNTQKYLRFLEENNLPFKLESKQTLPLNYSNIESVIKVKENGLDIGNLYSVLINRLRKAKVKIRTNVKFKPEFVSIYDLVVNCTYANINNILPEAEKQTYQFELVEKPIVSVGEEWQKRSVVVMDGEFCCIDPYGKSSYFHVLGHVREAIHETQIGHEFKVKPEYKPLLNQGIIKTDLSRFDSIINDCKNYFKFESLPTLPMSDKGSNKKINENIYHHGSMFTIRTVLTNRDHDDARPSIITKHSDQLYSVFGGKIGTSVQIANDLIKLI